MKLSDLSAGNVTLPAGKKDHVVYDDLVPRFGVRIRESGTRTWIIKYKLTIAGRKPIERTVTLGEVGAMRAADARKAAEQIRAKVRLGQDPAADRVAAKTKATELRTGARIKEYLAARQSEVKLRSYKEIERHLMVCAKPLHGLTLASLEEKTDRSIGHLFESITKNSGNTSANRALESLSAFFNWCRKSPRYYMTLNPAGLIEAHKENKRKRTLSADEIRLVWECLPAAGDDYGDICRLLLLTGQRKSEIADLAWSEIIGTVIELPAERVKNGEEHTVPLSEPARAIIAKREVWKGRDLVFGNGDGGFSGWSHSKTRLDAAIAEKNGKPLKPWVIHDLRRTVVTGMAEIGILPHIIEAVVNHLSGHKAGIAGTYNGAEYLEPKTEALAEWAKYVTAVIEGRDADAEAMRKRKRMAIAAPRIEDIAAAA
jgi:integrase